MYMETFERRITALSNTIFGKKPVYRVYTDKDEQTGDKIYVLELRVDNIFLRLVSGESYAPLFYRALRMVKGIVEKKYSEGVRRRKKAETETETYEIVE